MTGLSQTSTLLTRVIWVSELNHVMFTVSNKGEDKVACLSLMGAAIFFSLRLFFSLSLCLSLSLSLPPSPPLLCLSLHVKISIWLLLPWDVVANGSCFYRLNNMGKEWKAISQMQQHLTLMRAIYQLEIFPTATGSLLDAIYGLFR